MKICLNGGEMHGFRPNNEDPASICTELYLCNEMKHTKLEYPDDQILTILFISDDGDVFFFFSVIYVAF